MLIGMLIGRGQMPIGRRKDADRDAYRKGGRMSIEERGMLMGKGEGSFPFHVCIPLSIPIGIPPSYMHPYRHPYSHLPPPPFLQASL